MYAPGDITIMAWIANDDTGTRRLIANPGVGALNAENDFLFEKLTNEDLRIVFFTTAGGSPLATKSGVSTDGSWQHVVGRMSGTTINAYVDGTKGGDGTFSGTQTDNAADLLIAGFNTAAVSNFDGDIYYFMIVGGALSDTIIAALSRGVNPFGIWAMFTKRAFLPINGNQSPEPNWISGGNTGTVVSAPPKSANPPIQLLQMYMP